MLDWLVNKLIIIPGILVGLSVHEFGHALVAKLCGDNTAEYQGRVSLDPFAHIDWIGLASLLLLGFGWGKPVMVNPRNFKHPRRDSIFVGLAGVFMNFIAAFVFAFILRLIEQFAPLSFYETNVSSVIIQIILQTIVINVSLMLFNLIPIPPLDGFGIVSDLINLPIKNFKLYVWLRTYGPRILLLLIIIGTPSKVLSVPVTSVYYWILNTAFIGL